MKHVRRIFALARKDIKDAIRDARVLVALIIPLGIGGFYGFLFDDTQTTIVKTTIAISSPDQSVLIGAITAALPQNVHVDVRTFPNRQAVIDEVGKGKEDIGIILPAGFDAAVRAGQEPDLTVVRSPDPSLGGDYVLTALDPALRQMAGQGAPARLEVINAPELTRGDITSRVGLRTWSVILSMIMSISLVAILAIPIVLVEEVEKKTLDALILAMDYWEVVVAKTLVGLTYVAAMIAILLGMTRIAILDWFVFVATISLLAIALLGIGLLLAGLFRSANQLNTWSGLLLTPLILPAIFMGPPLPDRIISILRLFPTGAGMQLLLNSVTHEKLFGGQPTLFAIILIWIVVTYTLLIIRLNRTQA
ncbi:MAG TPA: ABC transporter permease subunit [Thermomicrobiales bacterium]|nr:ABC transporter permease subunit [Thermomicrobiales bacterium]HRA47331.1 ABC transporter permease subunit [Thermomicrobiales bacterium]